MGSPFSAPCLTFLTNKSAYWLIMGNIYTQNKIPSIVKWGAQFPVDTALPRTKQEVPLTQKDILEEVSTQRTLHGKGLWSSTVTVPSDEIITSLPLWAFHWWRLETAMFLISSILHSQIRWLLFSKFPLDRRSRIQRERDVTIYICLENSTVIKNPRYYLFKNIYDCIVVYYIVVY